MRPDKTRNSGDLELPLEEWDSQMSIDQRTMATDPANWERKGFPSRKVQDQIQAITDEQNTPSTRMTLLASLKDSLEG
jgi:hypothetical protein